MVSCPTDQGDCISTNRDKRKEPRTPIQALPVKINGECAQLYGYSRDISSSGMQVRAFALCPDWPKPVGERISIAFEMPDKGVDFSCKAEVVWNAVPPGGPSSMALQGIKFVDMESEAKARINHWLKGFRV